MSKTEDTPLTSDTDYINEIIVSLNAKLDMKNLVITDLTNRLTIMEDAYEKRIDATAVRVSKKIATLTTDLAVVTDAFLKLQDEVRGASIETVVAIALEDAPLSDDEYLESVKMNAPADWDDLAAGTTDREFFDNIKAAVICGDTHRSKRLNASFPDRPFTQI